MLQELEGDKMAPDGFEGSRKTMWCGRGSRRPLGDVSDQDIQGGEGGDFHTEGMMLISKPLEYSVPWLRDKV